MFTELQIAITSGLLSMLGWGLSDFFAKKTVGKIDESRTLIWSQLMGAVPIFFYLLFNFSIPTFTFKILIYLLLFGFFDGIAYLLYYRGLNKGKASVISPVASSYAVIVVLISALIFSEVITSIGWLGLGITFIGIILASFDYRKFRQIDFELRDLSKGIPETLLAVVIWGLFFPFWDKFLENSGWILFVLLIRFVVALTIMSISSFKKQPILVKDKKLWKWLIIIGFLEAGAFLSMTWGLNYTRITSVVTVLAATAPAITIILARIFLNEKMSLTQKLGVIFVLIGIIIISF